MHMYSGNISVSGITITWEEFIFLKHFTGIQILWLLSINIFPLKCIIFLLCNEFSAGGETRGTQHFVEVAALF